MSQRLQVTLDEKELREIQRIAHQKQLTVSEWVRQALRTARQRERDAGRKLKAVRRAARHVFPAGGIGQMLAEIQPGVTGEPDSSLTVCEQATDLAVCEGSGDLDPEGLGLLAKRLADARDHPVKAARLKERLTRGFYGI